MAIEPTREHQWQAILKLDHSAGCLNYTNEGGVILLVDIPNHLESRLQILRIDNKHTKDQEFLFKKHIFLSPHKLQMNQ